MGFQSTMRELVEEGKWIKRRRLLKRGCFQCFSKLFGLFSYQRRRRNEPVLLRAGVSASRFLIETGLSRSLATGARVAGVTAFWAEWY